MYSYYVKTQEKEFVEDDEPRLKVVDKQKSERYANYSIIYFWNSIFIFLFRLFFVDEYYVDNLWCFKFIISVLYIMGLIYMALAKKYDADNKRAMLSAELYGISLIFLMFGFLIFIFM